AVADPVQHLPLADHPPGARQPSDRAPAAGHGIAARIPQRGVHLGLRLQQPPGDRGQRRRVTAGHRPAARAAGAGERIGDRDRHPRRGYHRGRAARQHPAAAPPATLRAGLRGGAHLGRPLGSGAAHHPPPQPALVLLLNGPPCPPPGRSCSQALFAAWNRGLCGSRPLPALAWIWKLPWLLGSGKSEIPCARMHWANLRPCAFASACCAGLSAFRGGSSDLQALLAALNCGDLGSRPVRGRPPSAIPPWGLGSGKAVIPCARMHRENASALCLADPLADAAPVLGLAELEQAAARKARQASAAASRPARRTPSRLRPPCPPPWASVSYMSGSLSGAVDRACNSRCTAWAVAETVPLRGSPAPIKAAAAVLGHLVIRLVSAVKPF